MTKWHSQFSPLWPQTQSIESNPNIQTVSCVTGQSDCTQTCEFYSPEHKTSQLQTLFFLQNDFSLCYTLVVSIETPLRMTIVLFSSGGGGGGGSVFFVNLKSQNSTWQVFFLCVLVLYSFGHCASQFSVARQLTQRGYRDCRGEEKGQTTQGPSFPYTLLKKYTPHVRHKLCLCVICDPFKSKADTICVVFV